MCQLHAWTPQVASGHTTLYSIQSHPYDGQTPYAKVNQYLHYFLHNIGTLWSSLHLSLFPLSYNWNTFTMGVSRCFSKGFWPRSWCTFVLWSVLLWRTSALQFFVVCFALELLLWCMKWKCNINIFDSSPWFFIAIIPSWQWFTSHPIYFCLASFCAPLSYHFVFLSLPNHFNLWHFTYWTSPDLRPLAQIQFTAL